jgi:hypothetical protein
MKAPSLLSGKSNVSKIIIILLSSFTFFNSCTKSEEHPRKEVGAQNNDISQTPINLESKKENHKIDKKIDAVLTEFHSLNRKGKVDLINKYQGPSKMSSKFYIRILNDSEVEEGLKFIVVRKLNEETCNKDMIEKALIVTLKSDNKAMREDAIDALGRIGPSTKESIDSLIHFLHEGTRLEGPNAAKALGNTKVQFDRVISNLIKSINNKNIDVAMNAVKSIGNFGNRAEIAINDLYNALEHTNKYVRTEIGYRRISNESDHTFGKCQEKGKYRDGSGMDRRGTQIRGARCGTYLSQQQICQRMSGMRQMPGKSR